MTEQKITQELIDYANKHKVVKNGYYSKIAKTLGAYLWSISLGFRSRPRFYVRRKK